jgi:CheY-like chemotaxis protein
MTTDAGKRILVVDDEDDVITYLEALLTDAGYEVSTANNGQEALEAVSKGRPDLISLDITMPEKSGVRFYREMKENPDVAGIPIVILTGVTNPWSGPGGEKSFEKFISSRRQIPAPEGFFEKPVDREKYLAKLAELLA